MATVSAKEAALVLAKRAAKKSLTAWMLYRGAPYKPALHHQLLIAELEAVANGTTKRLMVCMPPGSAKSSYTSVEFATWYMGLFPDRSVIAASHTQELAERFARRVRNLVDEPKFKQVFNAGLSQDSQAAGRWDTDKGGEYFAAGVGGSITGRRADLGIIDDPVKSREDADSERAREKAWEWYVNDFLTRLKPNAPVVLVMCMTGDTKVLMADGSEKELKDIRPLDLVATNDNGELSTSKVLNWINQGPDNVYKIRTTSGRIVKANERHPFLVCRNGVQEWVRLRDLRVTDKMMCVGAHGRELSARLLGAKQRQKSKVSAISTTVEIGGPKGSGLRHTTMSTKGIPTFDTGTELMKVGIRQCLKSREVVAQYVDSHLQKKIPDLGLDFIFASTTATIPGLSEACFATTAISQLEELGLQNCLKQQQNISDFYLDEIVSIDMAGIEDVFDIQVEHTENFIANGCTASNTRWHEDDLGGRILEREGKNWKVISIPMEAMDNDPLGREVGDRLWPEWYTDDMLELAKMDTRSWWALYQQSPTSDTGDFFKKDWFNEYDVAPKGLKIYAASDYAVTEGSGDFTEHGICGVDPSGNLYILDWWRGQKAADHWIDRMADLVAKHEPSCWFGEAGPIRRSVEPFMMKRLQERGAHCRVEWLPSIHDKESRARGIQAMMAMGKVYWPKFAPWKSEVQGQLLRFPAGRHDDAVDVMSLFGRGLKFVNSSKVRTIKKFFEPITSWQAG